MEIFPPKNCLGRPKSCSGGLVLALLFFFTHGTEAGTWSFKKWLSDRDVPQPAPEVTTHAVAFGIQADPPVMAPFQITNKIAGETWSVWRHPDHTKMVVVSVYGQGRLDIMRVGGEGASILRGFVIPRGKEQGAGLSLELTGLEPGHSYNLALFGLGLSASRDAGKEKNEINITTSDSSDQPPSLDWEMKQGRKEPRFLVYEYVAPENGQLKVSFKSPEGDRRVRLGAFLNFRVD